MRDTKMVNREALRKMRSVVGSLSDGVAEMRSTLLDKKWEFYSKALCHFEKTYGVDTDLRVVGHKVLSLGWAVKVRGSHRGLLVRSCVMVGHDLEILER